MTVSVDFGLWFWLSESWGGAKKNPYVFVGAGRDIVFNSLRFCIEELLIYWELTNSRLLDII